MDGYNDYYGRGSFRCRGFLVTGVGRRAPPGRAETICGASAEAIVRSTALRYGLCPPPMPGAVIILGDEAPQSGHDKRSGAVPIG